jgi:hypothetical protein
VIAVLAEYYSQIGLVLAVVVCCPGLQHRIEAVAQRVQNELIFVLSGMEDFTRTASANVHYKRLRSQGRPCTAPHLLNLRPQLVDTFT